jgi:cold shock CspA family protein
VAHFDRRRRGYDDADYGSFSDAPPRVSYRRSAEAEAAEALFAPKSGGGPTGFPTVQARVKWYNPEKRMGFIVAAGGEEILLPGRVAEGYVDLAPGTSLTVEINPDRGGGGKSRVATRILNIDRSTAIAIGAGPNRPLVAATRTERGRLARKTAAGSGFFEPELGGVDVFLPRACFLGIDVKPGDRLEADIGNGSKGPVALKIRRI